MSLALCVVYVIGHLNSGISLKKQTNKNTPNKKNPPQNQQKQHKTNQKPDFDDN